MISTCISFAVEGLLQEAPEPPEHLGEVTEGPKDLLTKDQHQELKEAGL